MTRLRRGKRGTLTDLEAVLRPEEGGSVADDESTSDQGGEGVADELGDDLAQQDKLDVACAFDLDAFLRERTQQAPAAQRC